MHKFSTILLSAVAALALLATGCAKSASSQPPSSMPALSGTSLADTSWVLVSYGDPASLKTVIAGTHPTLVFNSDTTRISGSGGVNGFGGDCVRTDDQIAFSQLIHTEMASTNPDINAQENTYFQLLLGAQSVFFPGGELAVNCAGGKVLSFISAIS